MRYQTPFASRRAGDAVPGWRRWWWTLGVVLVVVFAASGATAQQVPSRTMGVRWDDSVPHLDFHVRDMVNAEVRKKLEGGLVQTIETKIYAYAKNRSKPLTIAPLKCEVTHRLWKQKYRVRLQTATKDETSFVDSLDEVIEKCLVMRDFPVGRSGDYERMDGGRVYFAVLVEFNPLSEETVQRIRRWLSRSSGGGGGLEGDAFFGSFVSLFVNRRIGDADRVIRFRSQTVSVP